MARTTIILPAMKSTGMQSRAVVPGPSPRKRHVPSALAVMRALDTCMGLGRPVEPDVRTLTLSASENHWRAKSKTARSASVQGAPASCEGV